MKVQNSEMVCINILYVYGGTPHLVTNRKSSLLSEEQGEGTRKSLKQAVSYLRDFEMIHPVLGF